MSIRHSVRRWSVRVQRTELPHGVLRERRLHDTVHGHVRYRRRHLCGVRSDHRERLLVERRLRLRFGSRVRHRAALYQQRLRL